MRKPSEHQMMILDNLFAGMSIIETPAKKHFKIQSGGGFSLSKRTLKNLLDRGIIKVCRVQYDTYGATMSVLFTKYVIAAKGRGLYKQCVSHNVLGALIKMERFMTEKGVSHEYPVMIEARLAISQAALEGR